MPMVYSYIRLLNIINACFCSSLSLASKLFRFSSLNQYISVQSQIGWLCFWQILTNFMLQYDPCKANSKLIKNSFSLLNFSVYPHIHKIRALDSMLGQWNPDQTFTPYFSKRALILSLYLPSMWSCHRGFLTKML